MKLIEKGRRRFFKKSAIVRDVSKMKEGKERRRIFASSKKGTGLKD